LWNSLLWFQGSGEPATQVAPGETISLDGGTGGLGAAGGTSQVSGSVTVTTPGGRVETVSVDPALGVAFFGDTSVPGVYRYRIGKKEDAFAVNIGTGGLVPTSGTRRSESDVRPVEDLGFKPEVVNAAELASVRPGGRAIWPYLLLAAALLLAFEAIVFHRRIYF
jgi:hypothetical protein